MAPPTAGYGAANNSSNGNGSNTRGTSDEEAPLLGYTPASKSSWRKRLSVNVSRDRADVVLLLCYIITGLLDSASISTWGSFVSMQTGLSQSQSRLLESSDDELVSYFMENGSIHKPI